MTRILITSGPTRQYLDPVRYLTNASSGLMGCALAKAALEMHFEVVIVSGPVDVKYPSAAEVLSVVSTEEMLEVSRKALPRCDGVIGAAAPSDYRPIKVEFDKITKTGMPLVLKLVETPDVVAALGAEKIESQWIVGFALETNDHHFRAINKMERKSCDLIVLNEPSAMNSRENQVEIIARTGTVIAALAGTKEHVAQGIMKVIREQLIGTRHR